MKYYNNDMDCKPGCDCGEDHDEIMTLTLELEDGTTEECEILKVLDFEGKTYIALLPFEKDEYLVYGCVEHGEEIELLNIEDEKEFEKVVDAFEEYFDNNNFFDDFDDDDEEEDEEDDKEEEKK
jgi:hypothetical protein